MVAWTQLCDNDDDDYDDGDDYDHNDRMVTMMMMMMTLMTMIMLMVVGGDGDNGCLDSFADFLPSLHQDVHVEQVIVVSVYAEEY